MSGRTAWTLAALVALAALVGAALGRPLPRQDDDDEAELTQLRGRRSFENNCLICHGAPIVTLSRLAPAQWKAELTKMIGWGAPVPDDEHEPLLAYLNLNFGVNSPAAQPGPITIRQAEAQVESQLLADDLAPTPTLLNRGAKVFAEHCASCHGTDAGGGLVGPNLVQKPILDRPHDFDVILREGRRRMPSFTQAIDEAAETNLRLWLSTK